MKSIRTVLILCCFLKITPSISQSNSNHAQRIAFKFLVERLNQLDKEGYHIIAYSVFDSFSGELEFYRTGDSLFFEAFIIDEGKRIHQSNLEVSSSTFDLKSRLKSDTSFGKKTLVRVKDNMHYTRFGIPTAQVRRDFHLVKSIITFGLEGIADEGIRMKGIIPKSVWSCGIIVYGRINYN